VLEQQLEQQERRQLQGQLELQQVLHQLGQQVLGQQQVLELALLLLFCHKRLKLLQRGLRVRGRAIFSFEESFKK
jgi:hypothetical protein